MNNLQLRTKIIPTFERDHPGYQMLLQVDHSQGHAAYSKDALLVSRMNLRPGGKQAMMRSGWFLDNDSQRVEQPMTYPANHPTHPNQPKGIKAVLEERNLWRDGLLKECKDSSCEYGATSCCASRILSIQPDFKEQGSLIQEIVTSAGHLVIFLPKYHCELNFIEYFWGATKKYLRDRCDYTFNTLKQNMPLALASTLIQTIRKWEHRSRRWIDCYESGLDAKEAQFKVREFSSRKYKSHRRIPEALASAMDL